MNINSLHIRVSLSVAAAALMVVALSSYFFYQHSYEESLNDSERSVQQLLVTVRASAAIAAYVSNRELAQQVVTGLAQNDIVMGAHIRAGTEILGEEGKRPGGTTASRPPVRLALSAPFDPNDEVGELVVEPNFPLIALRARNAALATTLSLATLAVVVALLVLIIVYWMMTRPLARLSMSLHAITPGEGGRLDVHGLHRDDEIGLLVTDINGLLGTVEKMLGEERELRHRVEILEHRFRGIFEDSSAGIFLVQENGALVTANPAFFRITGLEQLAPATQSDGSLIERVFVDPKQAESLVKLVLVSKRPCSADLRIHSEDGEDNRWVHCIFSPAGSDQQLATVEGVMYDVTQRKKAEERTRELAERDSLTGLANRQAAEAALKALISQSAFVGKGFVIMMVDLDGFKRINDTYGHDAGDRVLKVVAERLRKRVRDTDMVARLGGDEFLIVLKHADSQPMAQRVAQQIIESQQAPIEVQAEIHETVGMSIGIALYPEHGDNELSLRKHADQAMYAVKRSGKNGFCFYGEPQTVVVEKSG